MEYIQSVKGLRVLWRQSKILLASTPSALSKYMACVPFFWETLQCLAWIGKKSEVKKAWIEWSTMRRLKDWSSLLNQRKSLQFSDIFIKDTYHIMSLAYENSSKVFPSQANVSQKFLSSNSFHLHSFLFNSLSFKFPIPLSSLDMSPF